MAAACLVHACASRAAEHTSINLCTAFDARVAAWAAQAQRAKFGQPTGPFSAGWRQLGGLCTRAGLSSFAVHLSTRRHAAAMLLNASAQSLGGARGSGLHTQVSTSHCSDDAALLLLLPPPLPPPPPLPLLLLPPREPLCTWPLQSTMLARVLRHRGLAWLQLAAPAAGRATALDSSGLLGSAGSGLRPQQRGLLAAAARRSSSSTGTASEAAANEAATEAVVAEAAAPRRRGRPPKTPDAAEASPDAAAPRQARKRAPRAAPAAARSGTVVLVESPAKAKKIQSFLGKDFTVGQCGGVQCMCALCVGSSLQGWKAAVRATTMDTFILQLVLLLLFLTICRCWPATAMCGTCRPSRTPWCPTKASEQGRGGLPEAGGGSGRPTRGGNAAGIVPNADQYLLQGLRWCGS